MNKERVKNVNETVFVYVSGLELLIGDFDLFGGIFLDLGRVEDIDYAVAVNIAEKLLGRSFGLFGCDRDCSRACDLC